MIFIRSNNTILCLVSDCRVSGSKLFLNWNEPTAITREYRQSNRSSIETNQEACSNCPPCTVYTLPVNLWVLSLLSDCVADDTYLSVLFFRKVSAVEFLRTLQQWIFHCLPTVAIFIWPFTASCLAGENSVQSSFLLFVFFLRFFLFLCKSWENSPGDSAHLAQYKIS